MENGWPLTPVSWTKKIPPLNRKVFQETFRITLMIPVPDPRCERWAICILESVKFPKIVSGDLSMAGWDDTLIKWGSSDSHLTPTQFIPPLWIRFLNSSMSLSWHSFCSWRPNVRPTKIRMWQDLAFSSGWNPLSCQRIEDFSSCSSCLWPVNEDSVKWVWGQMNTHEGLWPNPSP